MDRYLASFISWVVDMLCMVLLLLSYRSISNDLVPFLRHKNNGFQDRGSYELYTSIGIRQLFIGVGVLSC